MKVTFYGTGSSEGFPSMFCSCDACTMARQLGGKNIRTRSSCGVDNEILVDFPADTFAHSIWGGLDIREIKTILFTHPHMDHLYAGELLNSAPPMAIRKDTEDIKIFGPKETIDAIVETVKIETRGRVPVEVRTLQPMEKISVNGYTITAVLTNHDAAVDCYIYIIEKAGKTLLYGNDSSMFPEHTWKELLKHKYDCVILDCTSGTASRVFGTHMGFDEIVEVKEKLSAEGCVDNNTIFIATHFAHTYAPLHERITPIFAEIGFIAAYDGLSVEF